MFEKLDLRKASVKEELDFANLFGDQKSYVVSSLILAKYKNIKLNKLFHLYLNGEIDVRYAYKIDINQLLQYKPENLMEKYCGDKTNSQEDDMHKKHEQIYELYKNKASLDDIYTVFIDTIMIEKYDEKTIAIHGLSKVYEATTDDGAFYAKIFKCQPFIYENGFLYVIQVDVYEMDKILQVF